MSTLIKICGLTTTDAVEAAVEAGADALGFVFAESVRRIRPEMASRLTAVLPPGVVKVAVMRHPSQGDVDEVMACLTPDFLQTDAEDYDRITLAGTCRPLPVYRAGRPISERLPRLMLFEGPVSGSGEVADWEQARKAALQTRVILAGGLTPGNVEQAMRAVRPYGVDVSSGVESEPGIKSTRLIRSFVEAVREAETGLDSIGADS
jgi:phosphoribosylanthranilate isomerase